MNPATALATVLVDELVRCGMTDAVLAPGSRSAPLALALAAEPRVRLHVRIDERSAAFLALGLARGSGRPAALVCTSGTAAANFFPAVLEASEADVPMIVLTADRPPELRGTGANQTIDQVKLYGPAVREFVELGLPEPVPGMVAYWRSLVARVYATAATGPVHLNVAFREPLIPDGRDDWLEPLEGRPGGAPWTVAHRGEPAVDLADLLAVERGLLVAGDSAPGAAVLPDLAAAAGWPLLAEPTSGARTGGNALAAWPALLGAPGFLDAHRPELVVVVGRATLSRPLLGLLASGVRVVQVAAGSRWPDPTRSATEVRLGVPQAPATAAAAAPPAPRRTAAAAAPPAPRRTAAAAPGTSEAAAGPGRWLHGWQQADTAAVAALDAVLDAEDGLTEPGVARDLAALAPPGSVLLAGSSMPIRDLNLIMRPRPGLRVVGNRGASGIDGLVSTAVGLALTAAGPAYGLLGDLSLLHDSNGLILGGGEIRPDLTLVVLNNDGGGIFSLLPQAGADGFERVFGTPHGVELAALAAACGWGHERLQRPADLAAALAAGPGPRLLEVRTDRAANADLHRRLQAAVAAVV